MSPNAQTHSKLLTIVDFAIVAKGGLFWFSIVASLQLICDVARMRVTALWRHIRRLFLHAQIGAKTITSE